MTDMTLQDAIAEVKAWVNSPLTKTGTAPPSERAQLIIFNAVASGELIPATNARLAVVEVQEWQRLAIAGNIVALEMRQVERDRDDALAQVQALRAMLDRAMEDNARLVSERDTHAKQGAEWASIAADNAERDEAADAKLAALGLVSNEDWQEPNLECAGCAGGDKWPLSETVWQCPVCDAEYYDETTEQEG